MCALVAMPFSPIECPSGQLQGPRQRHSIARPEGSNIHKLLGTVCGYVLDFENVTQQHFPVLKRYKALFRVHQPAMTKRAEEAEGCTDTQFHKQSPKGQRISTQGTHWIFHRSYHAFCLRKAIW